MKTLFTMGFAPQPSVFGFVPQRNAYVMGQAQTSAAYSIMNLAKIDRDRLLNDVNRAAEEYKAIMAWKNTNGSWQTLLGNDLAAFNDNLSRADEFSGQALTVQTRLSPSAQSWAVNGDEYNGATYWVGIIDTAYKLMAAHVGSVKASGGPAFVPVPASGPSPLVIGVTAVAAVGLLAVLLG